MGDSFQIFRGSLIRLSSRRVCSPGLTSSQYFSSRIPESAMAFSQAGASSRNRSVSSGWQKPITRSTPARLYQLRSKITTSPAAGKCWTYRCTYICVFSRSVGVGRATTLNTRGLTRSVIRLIVPPFPAVSRPSKTTQTLAPESFTHSCMATSSPCRILIWRSYCLRFIFGGGSAPASSPATEDDARLSASSRSRSSFFFFFLAILLPPINAVISLSFRNAREVSQPGPVPRRLRRRDSRAVPRYPDAERAGGDCAGNRRRHQDRLAVDADRYLRHIGVDLDLLRGQHAQPGGMPAAEQACGLPRARHRDADDAEDAAVQPRAPAQPCNIPGSVGIVGHQQRLRGLDRRAVRLRAQPCSAMALQQVRKRIQGRIQLVAAVGRGLDHLRVRAERRVVDERLAVDHPEVDPQLDSIGQSTQTGGRVLAIQPQVEGEVIARARADDDERDAVLGRDPGHEGLRSVASGDAEQVGACLDGLAGHLGDIDGLGAANEEHLGAEFFGLALQVELRDLPAAGLRVHDQVRVSGRRLRWVLGPAPAARSCPPAAIPRPTGALSTAGP